MSTTPYALPVRRNSTPPYVARIQREPKSPTWVRRPTNLEVLVATTNADPVIWSGRVTRLWAQGLDFLGREPVLPGMTLRLKLQGYDQPLTRTLEARVTNATADLRGHWLIRCQFVEELGDSERRHLL